MKPVKAHGNTKLVKGPWKPKASKWAKDAQGKTKGTQEPINKKAYGRVKPLGKNTWETQKGPAGSSHYSRNDRVIWQDMMTIKKWAGRNVKPSIKGSPTPKVSREL